MPVFTHSTAINIVFLFARLQVFNTVNNRYGKHREHSYPHGHVEIQVAYGFVQDILVRGTPIKNRL
jgi:hypothetical protein